MKRPIKLALLAICATVAAASVAQGQTRGPYGDRDHDRVPNAFDRRPNTPYR